MDTLSYEKRKRIRDLSRTDMTQKAIAEDVGCGVDTVRKYQKMWKKNDYEWLIESERSDIYTEYAAMLSGEITVNQRAMVLDKIARLLHLYDIPPKEPQDATAFERLAAVRNARTRNTAT